MRLKLKDKLTFGKYKGKTIQDILYDDPQYLVWLHQNTEHKLQSKTYNEAQLKIYDFDEGE